MLNLNKIKVSLAILIFQLSTGCSSYQIRADSKVRNLNSPPETKSAQFSENYNDQTKDFLNGTAKPPQTIKSNFPRLVCYDRDGKRHEYYDFSLSDCGSLDIEKAN